MTAQFYPWVWLTTLKALIKDYGMNCTAQKISESCYLKQYFQTSIARQKSRQAYWLKKDQIKHDQYEDLIKHAETDIAKIFRIIETKYKKKNEFDMSEGQQQQMQEILQEIQMTCTKDKESTQTIEFAEQQQIKVVNKKKKKKSVKIIDAEKEGEEGIVTSLHQFIKTNAKLKEPKLKEPYIFKPPKINEAYNKKIQQEIDDYLKSTQNKE